MIPHLVIDTGSGINDFSTFGIFFYELSAEGKFHFLNTAHSTQNKGDLAHLRKLIFRYLLKENFRSYSLIFLISLYEEDPGAHPLNGCLVEQFHLLKNEILHHLKDSNVPPVTIWIIVLGKLSRDPATGKPAEQGAKSRWEFDSRGYVSEKVPGVFDESEIESLSSGSNLVDELIDKKIKEIKNLENVIPSFLNEKKLTEVGQKIKETLNNHTGNYSGSPTDLIKSLLKNEFSILGRQFTDFKILRFEMSGGPLGRLDEGLVKLANLILLIMSEKADNTFNTTGQKIWLIEGIDISPERLGALITYYLESLTRLKNKLDAHTNAPFETTIEIVSDNLCNCQAELDSFEVKKLDFTVLLNREEPERWKEKISEWQEKLDKQDESARQQIQGCYEHTRRNSSRCEKKETDLGAFIRSTETKLQKNRIELLKTLSSASGPDPEKWRKNREFYEKSVGEALNSRPTWLVLFLSVVLSIVVIARTWLYPINYSGNTFYYSGFVVLGLLPVLALLTSLRSITNHIEELMGNVTREIHKFSKDIVGFFTNRIDLVKRVCKNGILYDNLQRAKLKEKEMRLNNRLALYHMACIEEHIELAKTIKGCFAEDMDNFALGNSEFADDEKFDLSRPINTNPFYALNNKHRVSKLKGIPNNTILNPPGRIDYPDYLYVLDNIRVV